MTKIEALAKHLDTSIDDIREYNIDYISEDNDDTFIVGTREYLVLTDKEADEKARESILESVWAFKPSFLAAHTGIDEDIIKSIQDNDKCEDNNDVFLKLIKDKDHFVSDSVFADGRGHFMGTYDGDEHEVSYSDNDGKTQFLYIYRIN